MHFCPTVPHVPCFSHVTCCIHWVYNILRFLCSRSMPCALALGPRNCAAIYWRLGARKRTNADHLYRFLLDILHSPFETCVFFLALFLILFFFFFFFFHTPTPLFFFFFFLFLSIFSKIA
ncbi:unnamed protein product, partial [Penicillium nalgiovense]